MAIALFGLAARAQRGTVTDEQRGLSIYEVMVGSFQHDPAGAPGLPGGDDADADQ